VGFLRRLGGSRPGPVWAGSLDAKGFERFLGVLDAEMRRRGWTYRRQDDGLYVDGPAPEKDWVFGLSNIAQLCGGLDPTEWPQTVQRHFDNMLAANQISDDLFSDFEAVRPNLRLRLMPTDPEAGPKPDGAPDWVQYPVAPGLVAILAVDLPTSVATVPRDVVRDWPPADELHRIALDGVRAEAPPERQEIDVRGAKLLVEVGESFFTASRLLLLPEVLDLAGADGVLVAVPTRHSLAVHLIRDTTVLQALPSLAALARNMAQAGPGTISPAVYWWHAGAMTVIPTEIDAGDHVTILPPAAFIELLNEISARP
jgi:hypothetical protein